MPVGAYLLEKWGVGRNEEKLPEGIIRGNPYGEGAQFALQPRGTVFRTRITIV